jgi:hypothetical protein
MAQHSGSGWTTSYMWTLDGSGRHLILDLLRERQPIDANKDRQDYLLAHEIFPRSILCGDDWEWRDAKGEYAVRPFVHEVAEARKCDVVAERATWVLRPRQFLFG